MDQRKLRRHVVAILLAGIVFEACDDNAVPPPGNESRDSLGITIVSNGGLGWAVAQAWVRSPEPLVRLGEADGGNPATQFSYIESVARLSDGRILVLDYESRELRWFSRTGTHLQTTGGPGEGPGEFRAPSQIIVMPGDTVVIDDRPRIKHVFYAPDGHFVRAESPDFGRYAELEPVECPAGALPDRSLLLCQQLPGATTGMDPGPGLYRDSVRFVRATWDLDETASLGLYGRLEQWGLSRGGRTEFVLHPFFSRTHSDAGGDPLRFAIALNPQYEIEVWTLDGRLDRIVRRVGARRVPTREETEIGESSMLRFARNDEGYADRIRREVPIPDTIPAVTDLEIADDGGIWVGRSLAHPELGNTIYDVFNASGEYLGSMSFPPAFDIHEVGSDYVLGVRRDLLDIPYVELYGLRRAK